MNYSITFFGSSCCIRPSTNLYNQFSCSQAKQKCPRTNYFTLKVAYNSKTWTSTLTSHECIESLCLVKFTFPQRPTSDVTVILMVDDTLISINYIGKILAYCHPFISIMKQMLYQYC